MLSLRTTLCVALFTFAVFAVLYAPHGAEAQVGSGGSQVSGGVSPGCPVTYPRGSDRRPWDYTIACNAGMGPAGMVIGVCVKSQCLGQSFSSDVAGGALSKMGMDLLQQLVQKMMQGGGGGGGGGGVPYTDPNVHGCTQYFQVTEPSSDPCAIYNPNALFDPSLSAPSGIADSLLDALGGSPSPSPVSQTLLETTKSTTGTQTQTATSTQQPITPATSSATSLNPDLSGDVRIGSAGATIIANLRDGLSEVAGFFGGSTLGASQSVSVAGRLCASRPWAGSFVGAVIPTSFFDGLCERRGYQVGMVAPQGSPSTTSSGTTAPSRIPTGTQQQQLPPAQLPVSDIPPEAAIWAEPASVRLGTRTYIFWNARGVVSCTQSGPSFSQNSLSGGASTVSISTPTTFTIECLTPAGTTITDSVTVQIAI